MLKLFQKFLIEKYFHIFETFYLIKNTYVYFKYIHVIISVNIQKYEKIFQIKVYMESKDILMINDNKFDFRIILNCFMNVTFKFLNGI